MSMNRKTDLEVMRRIKESHDNSNKWFDDCSYITHSQWTYLNAEDVAKKLVELGNEIERLKDNLEEISEADCLGEVAKILRNCGIDT